MTALWIVTALAALVFVFAGIVAMDRPRDPRPVWAAVLAFCIAVWGLGLMLALLVARVAVA